MIRLAEMKGARPIEVAEGVVVTTAEVWEMLSACRSGDLGRVHALTKSCSALVDCRYDYTSPMHFAVREGHTEVVRYLIDNGAFDPGYRTHPFMEPLLVFAADREFSTIVDLLTSAMGSATSKGDRDTGKIDFAQTPTEQKFEALVDQGNHAEVEGMLKENPELARNELAFWGEGILAMPAKDGDRRMLELLMSFGARVPDASKWGARYYFKHYSVANFLLENGMNPNHTSWRGFTLMHDMAFCADVEKARLLLDHGADLNAVDDEYSSTPLGYAVHWGQEAMAQFLIQAGANVTTAGADWAMPLAWARKKKHWRLESTLLAAGA